MLQAQLVKATDLDKVRELWRYCFDDGEAFVQWYFTNYYRWDQTIGVYEENELLAATQMIPYTISLRKAALATGYIVGVSTAPEARRKGLSKIMLGKALEVMRQRHQYVALLMPFEGDFYYRYQWEFVYFHQKIAMPLAELSGESKPYGTMKRVEAAEHLEELAAVYRAFCRDKHGYVLRDSQQWQRVLSDIALENGYCYILYDLAGQAAGYAMYSYRGEDICVLEMAYQNHQVRCGLLDFFYGHRSHRQQLLWHAPVDDPMVYHLPKSKDRVVLYPFLMLRVVDVIGLLSSLYYDEDVPSFVIQMTDELAEWNNGCFAITVQGHQAHVRKTDDTHWDIAMDVGALSLLVAGSASANTLRDWGRLQSTDEAAFELWSRLWPIENNYIIEEY